eukprot:1389324-Pleurochrysis_carterae.AAC.1
MCTVGKPCNVQRDQSAQCRRKRALIAPRLSKERARCAPSAKHATCSAVKARSVGASVRSKRPESRKS